MPYSLFKCILRATDVLLKFDFSIFKRKVLFISFCYFREDNTYVDLDISEAENEEQPAVEYTQRGSVAFVREIASVYYKDVDIEKACIYDKAVVMFLELVDFL